MLTEDFIRQVARDISYRVLSGEASQQTAARDAQTLLIFEEEANDALRKAAKAAFPDSEFIRPSPEAEEPLRACKTVVIVAPSLDLASKITLLQTDCPTANFIIRALLANKRVVAVIEGMLAGRPPSDTPLSGIYRAVEDLRTKMAGLGIQLIPASEMGRIPEEPVMQVFKSIPLPVLGPQHASQHPSRQRIEVADSVNEFIDFLQTKQCTMEKGKPCDQCDICTTLGF
jgi:hypothetical protein